MSIIKTAHEIFLNYVIREMMDLETSYLFNYEADDIPPIIKIMHHRLKCVSDCRCNCDEMIVDVPDDFYVIINLMSNSPGTALVMLYHLLQTAATRRGGKLSIGDKIKGEDFAAAFPIYYDTNSVDSDREYLDNMWDNQKTQDKKNLVDQVDYWLKLFE